MASPPRPTKHLAGAPAPVADCDDILRQIFIRLDSHADLARACAASPGFRRIITDPHFLRRFRDLHPPPLLGILNRVFLPAEPPHRSASAAHKLVNDNAIDFSCKSFLPSPGPWFLRDSRDGRVLHSGLSRVAQQREICCGIHLDLDRPFAVCDPLHRRYFLLPAIPEELATLIDHGDCLKGFTTFLAPPAEEDGSTTLSFRVMCVAHSETKLALFEFSSSGVGGRPWRCINFDNWSGFTKDKHHQHPAFLQRSYAHGRFYWPIYPGKKKLLVLDVRGIIPVFSTMDFPSHIRRSSVAFVEAAGEKDGLAAVKGCKHKGEHVYHLHYDVQRGDSGDRWEPRATIDLPLGYSFSYFIGVAGGYLLLEGRTVSGPEIVCFSLDLRTLQLERFCGSKYSFSISTSFYAGCPSYLSPPTV